MATSFDCDVIVAGAGPAGSAAAIALARADLRVVVCEAQEFPRDKVCGDFLSAVAVGQLQAMGVTARTDLAGANILRDAALYLDGRQTQSMKCGDDALRPVGIGRPTTPSGARPCRNS